MLPTNICNIDIFKWIVLQLCALLTFIPYSLYFLIIILNQFIIESIDSISK